MKDKMLKEPKKGLKDSQSFEEKFSNKAKKPLQLPSGLPSQKLIDKKMKYWTDYNLQKFRGNR